MSGTAGYWIHRGGSLPTSGGVTLAPGRQTAGQFSSIWGRAAHRTSSCRGSTRRLPSPSSVVLAIRSCLESAAMVNGCSFRNRRRRGVADHACAARRWQAGTATDQPPGRVAEMCCPRPVRAARAGQGPVDLSHHSTHCAAKGSGSVPYRSTPEVRTFRQTEPAWHSWSKTLVR